MPTATPFFGNITGDNRMNVHANLGLIGIVSEELREMLGDEFDAETFFDTLDGETDISEIITRMLSQRNEAKTFAEASKAIAKDYTDRANRMEAKSKAIQRTFGTLLDATGERKIVHPLATLSRTKGRTSVKITDENQIPSQLTITTTKPDGAAIKKQLEANVDVPGAELVTGEQGVTVRIK